MRLFRTLALTTTAIITLATSVSANNYAGQLTSYSDQQVLNHLVREHARDPSTFEDAHAYILLNRPEIMEDYLSQTLDRAPDTRRFSFSELSAWETYGIGSMIILGIAGMTAAISLADNGGDENPDPEPSPSPNPSPSPDPITDPTDPVDPIDPAPEPVDPPTEPVDPPTEPVDPPAEPVDPPAEPVDPPAEPVDPPAEPVDPPAEPVDPLAEPDNYTGGYLYNDGGTLIELTSERDFEEIETLAAAVSEARNATTFVAQRSPSNWPYSAINLEYARGAGLTGAGQTIAIFDSGFLFSHDEFTAGDRTVANANNAAVSSHGTAVASIAAGSDDSGQIEGVAPNANLRLFGWDSLGDEPVTWEASIADAAEHGAIVHNNSWGLVASILEGRSYFTAVYGDAFEADLIDYTKKAVVVFAADNNSDRSESLYLEALPALIPELEQGWLAVINLRVPYNQASDSFGEIIRFSSACWQSARWCIGADGSVQVASSNVDSDSAYGRSGGTSLAAPQVAGAIALLAEAFPGLSASQLRNRLLATADNSFFEHTHTLEFEGGFSHGYNEEFGHGLMDLRAALLPIGTLYTRSASGEQLVLGQAAIVGGGASGDALVKGLANLPVLSMDRMAGDFRLDASSFVRQASWSNPLPDAAFSVERANLARDRDLTRLRAQRARPGLDVTPSRFYGAGNALESYRGVLLPLYASETQRTDLLIPSDSEGDIGFEASYLRQFGRSAITFGLSSIYDTDGVLGITSTGTSDPLASVSTSLNLSWSLPLNDQSSFQVSGQFGLADARARGLINDFSRLRYASYKVAYDRADTFQQGNTLTLFVQRPTRIESGTATVELASGRNSNNELTYTQYDIDLSPSAHQVDFGFDYRMPLGNQAEFHLGMLHSTNAGHISGETSTAGLIRVQWHF